MSTICIIPARGGSQRIPRKNIRLFHGKPIIAYSIEAAIQSGVFEHVVVSTDDGEIAAVSEWYGANVLKRSKHLAEDSIGTQEVMGDALKTLDRPSIDIACCLYPTAPMLAPGTLSLASFLLKKINSSYVVPVATWLSDPGQFYIGHADAFRNRRDLRNCTLLPIDPSTECDINTEDDWIRAEKMYAKLKGLK